MKKPTYLLLALRRGSTLMNELLLGWVVSEAIPKLTKPQDAGEMSTKEVITQCSPWRLLAGNAFNLVEEACEVFIPFIHKPVHVISAVGFRPRR